VYQAQAELVERRAALALARQQLADTTIRAPFSARLPGGRRRSASYLAVNAPVVLLVRQNPMRLRLQIPERLSPKVRPAQRIDVRVEGSVNRTGTVMRLSLRLRRRTARC